MATTSKLARPAHMKHRSSELTDDPQRAPARAMLMAMGLTQDDLKKPFVAISMALARRSRRGYRNELERFLA